MIKTSRALAGIVALGAAACFSFAPDAGAQGPSEGPPPAKAPRRAAITRSMNGLAAPAS